MIKKHKLSIMTIVLCAAFVVLLPLAAMATDVGNFSNFTYKDYFTAEYTVESTSGSATASGNSITITATGVTASCTLGSNTPSTTTVTLIAQQTVSVTCKVGNNVTLAVAGEITTDGDSKTFILPANKEASFSVRASKGDEVSGSVEFTNVEPAVSKVPEDCALYSYGDNVYNYLDEALTDATAGGGIITVTGSGKVYHSSVETDDSYASKTFTYDIPKNVNLLLPYASGKSNFDEKPDMSGTSKYYYNTQTPFVELTVPANTTINCSGKICVDSQVFADTLYSGCPGGPHGKLVLEQGSALNMKSGSTLYAWGYITGVAANNVYTTGTVTAESGSIIYESFQALGWRGGSLMKLWMNSSVSKSFAFADYALQNIEANLQVNNGATMKFTTSLEGSGSNAQVSGTFIANSTGFLQMDTTGSVLRTYDPYNNRIKYDLFGTMSVANLNMTLASLGSVDSMGYILGLNHSMDMVINSKAKITMLYDYKIMPGASVTINSGGEVTVNGKIYIYDTADYVIDGLTYAHHQSYTWLKSIPVSYIAATGYKSDGFGQVWNQGISQISASTPSGKVVINGVLTIESTGGIYTSSNGGKTSNKVITGTDTGTIINNSTVASIVTDVLDEAKTTYAKSGSKIEDQNKVVTPAVGLIKGLSTSASDYRCFEAGKTYYGSADGYWYEYKISKSVDGAAAEVFGYVGNGSTINYSSNVASSLTPANGSFSFNAGEAVVTTSNGKLTNDGNGNYTLTGVTADTILTFTSPCNHSNPSIQNEVPANCTFDGVKVHYLCNGCGKYFTDDACTDEIKDLAEWKAAEGQGLIPVNGKHTDTQAHGDEGYMECDGCGKKLFKLVSMNANADARTELVLKFEVHSDLASEECVTVAFDSKGDTEAKPEIVIEETESGNFVYVTQPVASALMTEDVTVSFSNNDETVYLTGSADASVSRSIVDYARAVLKSSSTTKEAKDLVTYLVTYGGYAQLYFAGQEGYEDVPTDYLAYNVLEELRIPIPSLDDIQIDHNLADAEEANYFTVAQNAYLGAAIKQDVFFVMQDGYTISGEITLTYKDKVGGDYKQRKLTPVYDLTKKEYCLTILNIPAAFLDYDYTLTGTVVHTDGTSVSFSVTPRITAYLGRILAAYNARNIPEATEELVNLAKAMYRYNQAANVFFNDTDATVVAEMEVTE